MLSDGKTPVPNGKYWESLNDAIKDSGFDLNIVSNVLLKLILIYLYFLYSHPNI
jgi:hypothetical protein